MLVRGGAARKMANRKSREKQGNEKIERTSGQMGINFPESPKISNSTLPSKLVEASSNGRGISVWSFEVRVDACAVLVASPSSSSNSPRSHSSPSWNVNSHKYEATVWGLEYASYDVGIMFRQTSTNNTLRISKQLYFLPGSTISLCCSWTRPRHLKNEAMQCSGSRAIPPCKIFSNLWKWVK